MLFDKDKFAVVFLSRIADKKDRRFKHRTYRTSLAFSLKKCLFVISVWGEMHVQLNLRNTS